MDFEDFDPVPIVPKSIAQEEEDQFSDEDTSDEEYIGPEELEESNSTSNVHGEPLSQLLQRLQIPLCSDSLGHSTMSRAMTGSSICSTNTELTVLLLNSLVHTLKESTNSKAPLTPPTGIPSPLFFYTRPSTWTDQERNRLLSYKLIAPTVWLTLPTQTQKLLLDSLSPEQQQEYISQLAALGIHQDVSELGFVLLIMKFLIMLFQVLLKLFTLTNMLLNFIILIFLLLSLFIFPLRI